MSNNKVVRGLFKLGDPQTDQQWQHRNLWAEEGASGTKRIVIAAKDDQVQLLKAFLNCTIGPFGLLYILVVPRGGNEAGRYQSDGSLTKSQVLSFLDAFGQFLKEDARHSFWIRSIEDESMLVYDRHDLIYGYGLPVGFASILQQMQFRKVERSAINIPDPHSHHYHSEFDWAEAGLLSAIRWKRTGLLPSDES